MKVWIDLTNPAHVVVLRPLVDLLEAGGHEVTLTARPLSHTIELLDDWGHPYTAIGHHGGAGKLGKALAAGSRVARAFRFARGKNFDYGLAHGSTDLPPVGRVLGIPNTTMFDYEWARLQHEVNCRLATRVLVPDEIPADRLAQYGARPPKLVQYQGLKEEYYLADFEPDPAVLGELGLDTAQVVVLARTDDQRRALRDVDPALVVPERAVDGRSLAGLADLVISAGGTMIREAAVLGTPVWSIFEGRLGAVDEQLEREGRVLFLRDPAELVVEKAPAKRQRRGRRDPAELLRLALPDLR